MGHKGISRKRYKEQFSLNRSENLIIRKSMAQDFGFKDMLEK